MTQKVSYDTPDTRTSIGYVPSVRLRERSRVTRLLNGKPSGTIGSLQILESVDRDTGGTSSELEKTGLLLGIPGADDLPEVLNNLILLLVAAVIGVLLPVFHIDIGDTTNEQLEFTLVKDVDEIGGNKLVEARHEGIELLLDTLHDLPFRNQPAIWLAVSSGWRLGWFHSLNVLWLVLVGDGNIPATGYQINSATLAKLLIVNRKCEFHNSVNVIIPAMVLVWLFKRDCMHQTYSVHAKLRCRSSSTPSIS